MRYITDSTGRLLSVSFGATIECDGEACTEYTGGIPSGYSSIEGWYLVESEKLYRWKVVDGELTLDGEAVEPSSRHRVPLAEFNPFSEYMDRDQEGHKHFEPYCGSDGQVGFLFFNGDKVYILELSSSGLFLRYYSQGTFTDFQLT